MNEIKMRKLEDVFPYENNPRTITDEAVEAVAKSISEYGFRNPIIVDKNGVIIAGHTRRLASIKLGLKEVPCIVCDDLTEKQIKALRLADNKTGEESLWDNKKLLIELDGLDDLFTGFLESDWLTDLTTDEEKEVLEKAKGIVYKIVYKTSEKAKAESVKEYCEQLSI